MASVHPSDLDSAATDSVASSPRSEHYGSQDTRVRLMCSFGGKILPRPQDNQLRYVGGDTRIVAVHRSTTFSALINKLSKLSGFVNLTVKCQLPNEDLDALISLTTDEDVENVIQEYDRVSLNQNPHSTRLRLFLFAYGEDSRTSSISSLLDGSTNREHLFFDAFNSGSRLERVRSEASSIVSEGPDNLLGLDNSDGTQPRESKLKTRPILQDKLSASDPDSPAPVVSSPYCSTSSVVPSIPDLPPVKTKLDNQNLVTQQKQSTPEASSETIDSIPPGLVPNEHPGTPVMHYLPNSHYSGHHVQQIPIYYVPGSVPPGNMPIQPAQMRTPYLQQYQVSAGQIPLGYHQQPFPGMGQAYGGVDMRPITAMDPYDAGRGVPNGMDQEVYYGVRNVGPSMVPAYSTVVMQDGEDLQRTTSDTKSGRLYQPS